MAVARSGDDSESLVIPFAVGGCRCGHIASSLLVVIMGSKLSSLHDQELFLSSLMGLISRHIGYHRATLGCSCVSCDRRVRRNWVVKSTIHPVVGCMLLPGV